VSRWNKKQTISRRKVKEPEKRKYFITVTKNNWKENLWVILFNVGLVGFIIAVILAFLILVVKIF